MDSNLIGCDVGGGALDLHQFLFRPTWRHYATSERDIYICSSSTPRRRRTWHVRLSCRKKGAFANRC